MEIPSIQPNPQMEIPNLISIVLENGQYGFEVNTETRQVNLILSPFGMPFFKLIVPMPSLAFTQFYMAARAAMERLGSLSEEDGDGEADFPSAA